MQLPDHTKVAYFKQGMLLQESNMVTDMIIRCECFPKLCPNITIPECDFDQIAVIANPDECCKHYKCECPPKSKCKDIPKPTNLQPGQIAVKDESYCCPPWIVKCSGKCDPDPVCKENEQLEIVLPGECCNKSSCR